MSAQLEQSLVALAACEQKMDLAEREAEVFRINKTQLIYAERRDVLRTIPQFWYIVLAENDDFAEYIAVDDLKYLEAIDDVYVHYKVVDTQEIADYKDFSITISFKAAQGIEAQEVTKHFKTVVEDGEEKITSEAVDVKWPQALDSINPQLLKEKGPLSASAKKQYRQGMKSLFAWFAWTGLKPGKEFRAGEDLARLIVDQVFPYAVKYYTEALPGDDEDEDLDSEEGEELDLSDEEPEKKKARVD